MRAARRIPPVRHFYHVCASDPWAQPVREHVTALSDAEFRGAVTIGLSGPRGDRERTREVITRRFVLFGIPVPDTWAEASEGGEQVTLSAMRDYVTVHQEDTAIFYAHASSSGRDAVFRRVVAEQVIGDWMNCVRRLSRHEVIGCCQSAPGLAPAGGTGENAAPFFEGNAWWAQSSYLRKLPPPDVNGSRHDAAAWVGLGDPKVLDLLPDGLAPKPRESEGGLPCVLS